jgi:tetratricopeptide (TPR) repeat protein
LSQWNMTLAGINFSAIGGAADTHVPGLTRRTYALTQASVLLRYLARAFWPAGLVIDADVPLITTMRSPVFLGSCSLIAASLAVAWLLRRRTPLVLWGMVVFYVALLPQSSIMPTPDLMFEHRAYLSLAGVIWAVLGLAAAWSGASRATRYAGRVVVGAVIIILAAATFARGMVWRDELTLWRDAYAKSPHKQRVLINYANALVETGRVDEACTLLERAAGSWDPMMPEYAAVLATAYGRAGRLDAAIRMAALACTHDPRNPAARFNLAFLYYAAGSNDSALAQVDCLLATTPDYADAWYLSGLLRATINGQYHSATNHLHTYLRLQPQGEHQREATQLIELLEQRGGGERQ